MLFVGTECQQPPSLVRTYKFYLQCYIALIEMRSALRLFYLFFFFLFCFCFVVLFCFVFVLMSNYACFYCCRNGVTCVVFSEILIDSIIIAGSKDKFTFDFA